MRLGQFLSHAAGMRVALCQVPISSDPAVNLGRAKAALGDAAAAGAELAVLPEGTQAHFGSDLRADAEPTDGTICTGLVAAARAELAVCPVGTQAHFGSDLRAVAEPTDCSFCTGLAEAARDHGIAVVAGVFEPGPGDRVYNTAVAFDARGDLAAAYRKIHLFDALGQRESDQIAPGDEPMIAEIGGLRIGILICYDIRFPEHARALVARGADLVVVPACRAAGLFQEEHWVTLVRARAIENTVWVAAADQVPDRSE